MKTSAGILREKKNIKLSILDNEIMRCEKRHDASKHLPQRKMMVMLWTIVGLVDGTNLLHDQTNHGDVMRDWKLDGVHVRTLLLPATHRKIKRF